MTIINDSKIISMVYSKEICKIYFRIREKKESVQCTFLSLKMQYSEKHKQNNEQKNITKQ